jgi:ABC-type uncharacterized transport system fused permease/ATPase subunit
MEIRIIFATIRSAMAYLLDHYTEFTELQAIAKRLLEFYNHLEEISMETETANNKPEEGIVCPV